MAADELNCSDGAKMLIERMQSNPEEFEHTHDARWRDILDCARTVVDDDDHSQILSKRDAKAIMAAYDTHILEARLAARIINELMEPKKRKEKRTMTQQEVYRYAQRIMEDEYTRTYRRDEAQRLKEAQQGSILGNQAGGWWR